MKVYQNYFSRFVWLSLISVPIWLCNLESVQGQIPEIRNVDVTMVDVPVYNLASGKAAAFSQQHKWLQLAVEFETREEWWDELQFKYYVLMGTGANQRTFAGEITYVNIPRDDKHISLMYIHPNTVKRFNAGELPSRVGIQILFKDRPLTQLSWPNSTRDRWWEQFAPLRGYLLNPKDTPYFPINCDLLNQIKMLP